MKIIKLLAAWTLGIALMIVTAPISIIILGVADMEYSWTDYQNKIPPPRYVTKWLEFLDSPLRLFGVK